jgi:WhiB family transcriptional regulator, redox-sensing transcriptional regulator
MIWHEEGACYGHPNQKLWYPDIFDADGVEWFDDGTIWEAYGDTSEYYDEAREICDGCPVKEECMLHALAEKERIGMWGGLTPIERRRIERRERRQRLKEKRAKQS